MKTLLLALALLQLVGLTVAQQQETVHAITTALESQYVNEAEGRRLASALRQELQMGGFATATAPAAFAAAVERFLQAKSRDRHLLMWPGAPIDILKRGTGLSGPSIGRSEILQPGGIGYVEVRHFLSANQGNALSAQQIDGAMATVARASALVFDVRSNLGGDLAPVVHLASYLFAARTHLLSRSFRGEATLREVWTQGEVPGARLPGVPVYVLTNAGTFSAGEAFAFMLQRAGRALIVGERTGGGGYSGNFARLPHGFTMFVSIARTFDPRTGRGWQAEGVGPDHEVPAADALDVALRLARERAQ